MCRSGRGVNQCLGVAALTEPRAAAEPFAGCGGAKAVSRARQQHRGMRKFARRRRTLAAFTAIMSRLGRAASGAGGASHGSATWSTFKVHYTKLDEDQGPSQQSRREEAQTQQQQPPPQQQQRIKFVTPLPDYMSYCCCRCGHTHKFKAEELNTIVGNAFRMAYVAQLQRQPMLQDVISSKSEPHFRKEKSQPEVQTAASAASWKKSLIDVLKDSNRNSSTSNNSSSSSSSSRSSDSSNNNTRRKNSNNVTSNTSSLWQTDINQQEHCQEPNSWSNTSSEDGSMNLQLGSTGSATLRLSSVKAPNTIPGLRTNHNFGNVLSSLHTEDGCSTTKSVSQQSTPSSDESNSPTELNSYKRLADKPPLIKRLAMGLTSGRDVLGLNSEDDSCPLVSGGSTPTSPTSPTSPTTRPHSGGYINEAIIDSDSSSTWSTVLTTTTTTTAATTTATATTTFLPVSETLGSSINSNISAKNFNIENSRLAQNSAPSGASEGDLKSKRRSQISSWSSSAPTEASLLGSTSTPPPLPERTDSLNNRSEEGELRRAPWFQAGIPREITLEVLSQEPEGAFMVRESTSKPGCYALSLRVPREFQPSGIAHYLIMRTNKGYKIKGFTKEFTTLTALITHHSVMPELLPCPLSLSRYNPSFVRTDSSKDFADIDSDPDYNTLADFRKMMADLNV